MASMNKVMMIGNLTRDPETREFSNGGKVAAFTIAVNNRRQNDAGEWENDPCFLDCKCFNARSGRALADRVEEQLHKGDPCLIEGRMVQEKWENDAGERRSKLVVICYDVQKLERKQSSDRSPGAGYDEDNYSGYTGGGNQERQQAPAEQPQTYGGETSQDDDDIPFGFLPWLIGVCSTVPFLA